MTRWIATAEILTVLAIAGAAVGQEDDTDDVYEYLKRLTKENPDELYVRYFQDAESTITEEAVESMIDGVLTRSRIKRLTYYDWLVRRKRHD